jgi:hypothetical protein
MRSYAVCTHCCNGKMKSLLDISVLWTQSIQLTTVNESYLPESSLQSSSSELFKISQQIYPLYACTIEINLFNKPSGNLFVASLSHTFLKINKCSTLNLEMAAKVR